MKDLNLGEKTTRITETAIITTFMTLLVIIGYSTFPVIILFYPVPFVILGVKHKTKYNIYSIIASSVLIGILIDMFAGILIFLVFGLISITITYMINKKYKPQQILIGGTIVTIVTTLLTVVISGYITGVSFFTQINTFLTENMKLQLDILREMEFSTQQLYMIKDFLMATVEYIIIIIPTTLIISSVFIVYINYWMSTAILKRLGFKTVEVPRFMFFNLPSNIIMGSVVIIAAALVIRYMKLFYYETIFINTIIIISFVFFMQGLSVLVFLMNKRNIHKVTKFILIFIIIINVPLSLIITFIGLLDVILNFRKLKKVE
ncbi:DUF2232 domain-containing protein [Proteiniborus sp.]|uniref:DUF2232 domain-containing protein n=1 Tax=Proteiniborus sp. TaxID=2079015 RepID=UPI00331E2553